MTQNTTFHHTTEITEYTKTLGEMCPDIYSYTPAVGDYIALQYSFLNLEITSGKIIKINEVPSDILPMFKKFEDYEDLDDDECLIFDKYYDFYGNSYDKTFNTEAKDCLVRFEIELPQTSNDIFDIYLQDSTFKEVILQDKRVTAKLSKLNKTFVLTGTIRVFIDGHAVTTTKEIEDFKQSHATKNEVENVATSDNILSPVDLKNLNNILDTMCINEPEDYHPGSENVVRDLVHPSLYCYVKGVSKVEQSDLSNYKPTTTSNNKDTDFWGRKYEDSIYQWLPSEFFVDNNGKVSIKSYINNLSITKYPEAYTVLAKIFGDIFPMLEKVCDNLNNDFYGFEDNNKDSNISIPLRNRNLQVVTKIVEYKVNEEANFDGVWHVEGMSHENVLATGLCIIKRDENFQGADIEFRRFLFEDEAEDLIYSTPQNANRPTDTMGGGDVRPLGTLNTPAGRVIVFPNSHIHRLSNMSSTDGKDATRRILVFWLVNPNCPIPSSANIKEQQNIMSFDDAKKHRLNLMKERKLHKETFTEREVFLCEH